MGGAAGVRRAIVLISLCTLLGGCGSALEREFDELCAKAKRNVDRQIDPVESYFDATGNGCSTACFESLRARTVKFVEVLFLRNRFNELVRQAPGYNNSTLPPWDGLHAAFIADTEQCQTLFSAGEPIRHRSELERGCLRYRDQARLVSEYEWRDVITWKEAGGDFLSGSYLEVRVRRSGEKIASGGGYLFEGVFGLLPYRRQCVEPLNRDRFSFATVIKRQGGGLRD